MPHFQERFNPFRVDEIFGPFTQGSSFLATLICCFRCAKPQMIMMPKDWVLGSSPCCLLSRRRAQRAGAKEGSRGMRAPWPNKFDPTFWQIQSALFLFFCFSCPGRKLKPLPLRKRQRGRGRARSTLGRFLTSPQPSWSRPRPVLKTRTVARARASARSSDS